MRKQKGWKHWRRIAAAALALLLASGGVDMSAFAVRAETNDDDAAAKVQTVVTAFDGLDREIMEQQLPVGASEDDIIFPNTLTVTATQSAADTDTDEPETETDADAEADMQDGDATDADAVDTDAAAKKAAAQADDADATDTDADDTDAQRVGGAADTEKTAKEAASEDQSTVAAEDKKADADRENGAKESGADEKDAAKADADDTEDASDAKEDTDTEDADADDEEAAIIEDLFSVFTPLRVQAAGSEKSRLTLTGITWEIDPEESDGDTFDSSADSSGKCYVYVPVLPDTDADGNELCLDEDAELPMIYVLIGERGIMPLGTQTQLEIKNSENWNRNVDTKIYYKDLAYGSSSYTLPWYAAANDTEVPDVKLIYTLEDPDQDVIELCEDENDPTKTIVKPLNVGEVYIEATTDLDEQDTKDGTNLKDSYTDASALTFRICVSKPNDNKTIETLNKTYIAGRETAETIDLSAYMPADCGGIDTKTNSSVTTSASGIYEVAPALSSDVGTLSYTIASTAAANRSDTIKVEVRARNYNYYIVINVKTVDKYNVQPAGGASVTLQSDTLTYGEPLSKLKFKPVTFVDDGGNEVPGTLDWTAPDTKPDANQNITVDPISTAVTTEYEWTFTPDDPDYQTLTGEVAVEVDPAKPILVSAPVVAEQEYTGTSFVDSILNGNAQQQGVAKDIYGNPFDKMYWRFKDSTKIYTPGQYTVAVEGKAVDKQSTGTHGDSNYAYIETTVTLKVKKKAFSVVECTVGNYTHGDCLRDQALRATTYNPSKAGTAVWKAPDTKLSYSDDVQSFEWIFIPADPNYETYEGTTKVTVEKLKSYPSNQPAGNIYVPSSCKWLGDISLPSGWEWKQPNPESAPASGSYSVEYKGADKNAYQNTTKTITIYQHSNGNCNDIKESAVKVTTKPTCTEEGKGYTICDNCSNEVRAQIIIPAIGHHYQAGKPDTRGICTYTCTNSGCTASYMALASSSTGSSSGSSHHSHKGSGSTSGTAANVTSMSQSTAGSDMAGVPFIAGQAQGWDAIRSHIASIQDAAGGSVITIHMNGAAIVPSDILQMIRGKAVILVFDMGDGTAWMVNGLFMLAAAEGTPIAVYYADYLQGTLTLADVTVLPMDGMLAHIYTCAQHCFAITYEGAQMAVTP